MITRNGIYYNLELSHYKFKVPDTNMVFIFSSELHLFKFEDRYIDNRKDFNTKQRSKYRMNIQSIVLPDVLLYKKLESRGFLIVDERGNKICLENLICYGEKVMPKNLKEK